MTSARDEQLKELAPLPQEATPKLTLRCRHCGAMFHGSLTTPCPHCSPKRNPGTVPSEE